MQSMEQWRLKYKEWIQNNDIDLELRNELLKLTDEEIEDSFNRDLEFGTGGLRGIIGPGTNRMNINTVRRTTQGFADYLILKYKKENVKDTIEGIGDKDQTQLRVAISYDSRIKSELFAKASAEVLAANGIKAYIFNQLMPTPVLSFAVRAFSAQGGIMITASHNPAKYNGYKAYNRYGCQLNLDEAADVYKCIEAVDMFSGVKFSEFDKEATKGELIEIIGENVAADFIASVKKESLGVGIGKATGHDTRKINANLNVVYTPLNGAGNLWVRKILSEIGVENVSIVKEQELPDGNFPTCPYPNPEKKEALKLGLALCEELYEKYNKPSQGENLIPDILIASDPDSDRVGVAVLQAGKSKSENGNPSEHYKLISGNQIGILLVDFIIKMRKAAGDNLQDKIVFKTIVTSKMVDSVCKETGIECKDVLTGFKFIGEQICLLEDQGEEDRYLFGFEESYGYLKGSYVRDKDAINGSMLVCEMTAYYKHCGMTLLDALDALYVVYGYFINDLLDFSFDEFGGLDKMKNIMQAVRTAGFKEFCGMKIAETIDYLGETSLPKSDVLEFRLENGSSITIRPSGTEPKLKIYLEVKGDSRADGLNLLSCYSQEIKKWVE